MRRPSLRAVVTFAAVAGAAFFIFLQLQPGLLFAKTTPAGGDMGAHVWGPAYLRDHVLPHWRLSGWAPDWYDGFPAYHFYFPLPNLLIVFLSFFLPYGVAFKLITVLGLVTLPVAAWAFGRMLRLPYPTAPLFAVATIPFVFDRFHTIWGGNAAATLAGEFAFSIGLALALLFLGVLNEALETGRYRGVAAALLAATALCHLLPAAFAVAGAAVLIAVRRPGRARWGIVAVVGAVGFALAAFWFVPFVARMQYSNDMGWERTNAYLNNLIPFLRHDDAAAAATTRHWKIILPLAIVGMVVGMARRRRGAVVVTGIAAAMALGFRFVPAGPIWNARLLPFWYLFVYLLAAIAVAEGAIFVHDVFNPPSLEPAVPTEVGTRPPLPIAPAVAVLGTLLCAVLFAGIPLGAFDGHLRLPGDVRLPWLHLTSADSSFVPSWARWNYSGYERKPDYPEYREVVATMARIGKRDGCGRAMWEYEPELNRFGTPMALMLLPHWTSGCIGSMEGLFFESSATVPYHFLNQSELSKTPSRAMRGLPYRDLDVTNGVKHMQLLGVRYYLAISPEAQADADANADLRLLATTSSRNVSYSDGAKPRVWKVYQVADSPIVSGMAADPAVVRTGMRGKKAWIDGSVPWYQDASRWKVPLAVAGPANWPRVASPSASPPVKATRVAKISDIKTGDDRISFRVDHPGTPVLVKVSYFPNWKASGAKGPWRVTPNLMVVVPTSTHVSLHYGWTAPDLGGWLLTFLGIAALVLLSRRGPVDLPAPPARPAEEFADPFFVAQPGSDFEEVLTGARVDPAP